jgi:hypothetical protein
MYDPTTDGFANQDFYNNADLRYPWGVYDSNMRKPYEIPKSQQHATQYPSLPEEKLLNQMRPATSPVLTSVLPLNEQPILLNKYENFAPSDITITLDYNHLMCFIIFIILVSLVIIMKQLYNITTMLEQLSKPHSISL